VLNQPCLALIGTLQYITVLYTHLLVVLQEGSAPCMFLGHRLEHRQVSCGPNAQTRFKIFVLTAASVIRKP
jgi:hypothetical protein